MKHAILPPEKIKKDESPTFFAMRIQAMTAAHLGVGVIKLNWKQKDRLAQALGFQEYNEHLWSRKKSMDDFRRAVYNNSLVVSGDMILQTESRSTHESRSRGDGGMSRTSFFSRLPKAKSTVKKQVREGSEASNKTKTRKRG